MILNELEQLIPQYAANKVELASYKKLCDKENLRIKRLMKDFDLPKYETKDYKAVYSVQRREHINEEVLLEIAHLHGIPEIIKTKEYIDFDALENAIYNGKIPESIILEMDKAKETQEVVVLKVTKKKEK